MDQSKRIPQCTCPTYYNTQIRTDICTFTFCSIVGYETSAYCIWEIGLFIFPLSSEMTRRQNIKIVNPFQHNTSITKRMKYITWCILAYLCICIQSEIIMEYWQTFPYRIFKLLIYFDICLTKMVWNYRICTVFNVVLEANNISVNALGNASNDFTVHRLQLIADNMKPPVSENDIDTSIHQTNVNAI